MNKNFLSSAVISLGLMGQVLASTVDVDPIQAPPATVAAHTPESLLFMVPAVCQACKDRECFSRKLDQSLKLDANTSNLLLCRDFLLTDQIKSEVLARISAEKTSQNGGQVVEVLPKRDTAEAYTLMRAEVIKRVDFPKIEAFIYGLENLKSAQRAGMLRKLGWVVPCAMTSQDKHEMACAGESPLILVLSSDVKRMIFAMLPNESLGSLALANKSLLEQSSEQVANRLQPIRDRIHTEYHGRNVMLRPDLMFYPLSYMLLNAKCIKSGKGTLEQLLANELGNAALNGNALGGKTRFSFSTTRKGSENLALLLEHLYLVTVASTKVEGIF